MLAIFLLPLVLLHARLCLASCAHGTNLHRRQEQLQDFDYGPIRGPVNWHGLAPENVLCGTGLNQSPINIDSTIPIEQPGFVVMDVARQDAELLNPGTNVEVKLAGRSVVGGREFEMQQFHFHTPGEHPINGHQFEGEIHMVHAAVDDPNALLVVAIPIQVSSKRTVRSLERVSSQVHLIPEPGNVAPLQRLDISDLVTFVASSSFFHYTGSLTTPPCSEGVEFLITQQAIPLRVEAYNAIHQTIGHNARFVQAAIPAAENVLAAAARALGCQLPGGEVVAPPPTETIAPPEETAPPPPEDIAVPPEEVVIPPEGEVVPPEENAVVPPEGEVVPPEGEVVPPAEEAAVPPEEAVVPSEGEVIPPAEEVALPPAEVVHPPPVAVVHPPPEEAAVPPVEAPEEVEVEEPEEVEIEEPEEVEVEAPPQHLPAKAQAAPPKAQGKPHIRGRGWRY